MDKFSELIAQGVANFEYKNITQTTPLNIMEEPDYQMIRSYNNLYSIATNTNMLRTEDGEIIIVGTLVKDPKYFDRFLWSQYYKNLTFTKSLGSFLRDYGYTGCYTSINNDSVYMLRSLSSDEIMNTIGAPTIQSDSCVCACEGGIPENIRFISINADINDIKECFSQKDVIKALNESKNIIGNNWIIAGLSDGYHLIELDSKLMIK